jgi:hypothetical protein
MVIQKETVINTILDSSNILKAVYVVESSILFIYFSSGTVYKYNNVDQETHRQLIEAESHGKFFNKEIKKNPDKFPHTKYVTLKDFEIKDLQLIIENYRAKQENGESTEPAIIK